jgi:thiol-disulfide isomerase/thioredoxin
MAAVLVLGFVGYRVLTTGHAASDVAARDDAGDAGPSSSSTADGQTDAQGTAVPDVPILQDYDATVYTDANEAVTLLQIADGKPLVMNFWATWCPYCVQEMPDFQQLYAEYGDRVSFAFIDVTDGSKETADAAKSWLSDNGLDDLPAYYDLDLDASAKFGARALPTTVVVSADGQILGVGSGRIDPERMRTTLDSLV